MLHFCLNNSEEEWAVTEFVEDVGFAFLEKPCVSTSKFARTEVRHRSLLSQNGPGILTRTFVENLRMIY